MNRTRSAPVFVALAALASSVFAQAPAGGKPVAEGPKLPLNPPKVSTKSTFAYEVVADHLQVPWAFAFLPDGKRMLFTERPGRVRMIEDRKLNPTPVFTVPDVAPLAERGLMGICLHPEFAASSFVYLAYATEGDIRVVRYTFRPVPRSAGGAEDDPGGLIEPKVILQGLPTRANNGNHAGCRIRFGPDKKLYITAGENFRKEFAPDLTNPGGKILRLNDDGTVPPDNPFTSDEHKARGVRPEIWSYGNRNPQGIDWDPRTGLLWETEHGPSGERGVTPGMGGDELNIIEKGHDYGWPTIHHGLHKEGMETPVIEWTPAIAPASGSFYYGDLIPEWKGNFFVGALGGLGGGRRPGIVRLVIDGRTVTGIEWIGAQYGRIREVMQAPDGALWFATSNKDGRSQSPDAADDRIIRIVPTKD
jgi:aldose sugar dehydrogenase